MGEFVPTHLLILETVDDTELPVTGIKNPIYIPKVGEVFDYVDVILNEDSSTTEINTKLEVVSHRFEIRLVMGPEQIVTIEVKKVG